MSASLIHLQRMTPTWQNEACKNMIRGTQLSCACAPGTFVNHFFTQEYCVEIGLMQPNTASVKMKWIDKYFK